MPKYEVSGYYTKKWKKVVEAENEDEAQDIADETWRDKDVWGSDWEIVSVEKIEE